MRRFARPGFAGKVVGSIPTRSTKFTSGRFDPHNISSDMPAVYVLQSETSKRFYIGCAEQPEARLLEHNRGQTISIRGRGPWILVYQEPFDSLAQARLRERQLKSWKSHRSIQEMIDASTKQR